MARIMASDGATIDYERVGSGPLVVLVAAMPAAVTAALTRELARDYSVLLYDPGARDVAGLVADLLALLAVAGEPALVFATDRAAVPALEAAAAVPRKIAALALYQPRLAPGDPVSTPPEHWQNAIMPVLVIDGDQGPPDGAAHADWLIASLHNGQRLTLADQGADVDPQILAPVLTVFFEMGSVQVH